MNDLDRSSWTRRPMSRRRVLGGMAALGAAGAGSLLAACSGTPAATSTPTSPPAPTPAPSLAPGATPPPTPEPTPVPSPEGELFVYNYDEYIGEQTIPSFEEKYGIRVTYDVFTNYDEMTTKISTGNSGYDITFATGVDVPGFLRQPGLPWISR